MRRAYVIDTDDDGRWLYLYCPVCAAVYQVGPLDDPSCPNAGQDDHPACSDGGRR